MLALILLLQTLTVAVSGPATSAEYLPLRVADTEGYFARERLEVKLQMTRAEVGAAEALAQGQVDLAATSLEALLRFGPRMAHHSPRLVFGLTAAPPVALLVAEPFAARIRSVSDLAGSRIGVTAPGAPEQNWFGALLARASLTLTQVELVSAGGRGIVTALDSGDVQAAIVHEPFASRLLAERRAALLADFRTAAVVAKTLGHSTVNAAVFMRLDRRPRDADLTAFARALLAAERLLTGDRAEALAERLPKNVVGTRDDFKARLAAARGLYLPNGSVNAEQLRETVSLIRAYTPLPATLRVPRAEEMLHSAPLRRAISGR